MKNFRKLKNLSEIEGYINVECECDGDVEPISFSAKYLKEILNANKGAKSSSLKISPNGLAHVSFENDGFKSNYYLVEIK